MAIRDVRLPKNLAEFVSNQSLADLIKAEQLLNALQNLKVQINIAGTQQTVQATIQINGESAVIVVNL